MCSIVWLLGRRNFSYAHKPLNYEFVDLGAAMQQRNWWDDEITDLEWIQTRIKDDPFFRLGVNDWKILQEEHLSKRRHRYATILNRELLHDVAMLKKPWSEPGQAGGPENPFANTRQMSLSTSAFPDGFPFISKTMDGNMIYPLQWLSAYPATYLSSDEQQAILKMSKDADWLNTALEFWKGDKYDPAARNSPAALVDFLTIFHNRRDEFVKLPEDDAWGIISDVVKLLQHLQIMKRLLDARNPEVSQAPLPDGSNFTADQHLLSAACLPVEYREIPLTSYLRVLHRCWLRTLHMRSLSFERRSPGMVHITQVLLLSLAFLDMELKDVSHDRYNAPAEHYPILGMYTYLEEALIKIAQDVAQRPAPMPTSTACTTLEYNINGQDGKVFAGIVEEHLGSMLPKVSLLLSLQELAAEFERRLDSEHVEDVLINKRIVVADEWYDIFEALQDEDYAPTDVQNWPMFKRDPFNLEMRIARMSEINRLRRNLLLLKNWNRKRPWQVNTYQDEGDYKEKHSAYLPAIREFHARLEFMRRLYPQIEPTTAANFNPSNRANVEASVFSIHPIATSDASTHPGHWNDGCIICSDAFDEVSVKIIARLHCDHLFHYSCIRGYWDGDKMLHFPCPLCRTATLDWTLARVADFTPEVEDVWDFEHKHGRQYIHGNGTPAVPPHRDLSNDYFVSEGEQRYMSMYHRNDYGYPMGMDVELIDGGPGYEVPNGGGYPSRGQISSTGFGLNRSADVEMAVVRHRRRLMNIRRRKELEKAGRTIASMDPAAPGFVPAQFEPFVLPPRRNPPSSPPGGF
ncbi:hypothetical protein JHW43_003421 [Diplocarpon mali]|nr:hypothetical protein JHW43_003421 [Diplocarpon mali]